MSDFGKYIREKREALAQLSPAFTLRQVAKKVGFQPSYLSKIERGEVPPPAEETIKRIAFVIEEDPDILLALAGKVSADLKNVIVKRPKLFADLLRQLKDAPDHAVLKIVREVRDGKW